MSLFKNRLSVVFALFFLFVWDVNAADLKTETATIDIDTPVITSALIKNTLAPGKSVRISAVVTDNVAVTSVTLFYRNVGDIDFQQVPMLRDKSGDDFSAVLSDLKEPGLEYYIQAGDQAENIVLRGHTFAPLTISVSTELNSFDNVNASLQKPTESNSKSGISNWVWVGLSALAVIAAVSSNGGDEETEKAGVVVIGAPAP